MDKYKNGLRIIETSRSFNEESINSFIDKGYTVLVREVIQSRKLLTTYSVIQDKKTNKIYIVGCYPHTYSHLPEYRCIRSITQIGFSKMKIVILPVDINY